jgi:ectoine hydroxylase-related dioxygenase (phytanoyl-CoA dioxygenase family)
MHTNIAAEKIEFYRENGFVVLEEFLDAAELEHWRQTVEAGMRVRLGTQGDAILSNQADPDAFYAQVFTQTVRLADVHAGMAELMFDERLGQMACALEGIDGIRIWHDQALVKPPYGNHTAFHMDNPFWSFHSKHAISIWVPLDDATLENGCLWYLPGTHKLATYESVGIGENLGDIFKHYPEWKKIAAKPAVAKAGSAVFHNGLLAHGAGVNMTPRHRRAMTCAYMPHDATFNGQRNILPEAYFNSLKIGDPLNDNDWNRLIWHQDGRHRQVVAA